MSYFENHPVYNNITNYEDIYNDYILKYNKEIWDYIKQYKKPKVLEIGFWLGIFANYCNHNKLSYTGIDIDDYFLASMQEKFSSFEFFKTTIKEFSEKNANTFDIIFMSHVFEHLDKAQREECIVEIWKMLKPWGIWINYMPNADSVLWAVHWRYCDYTHFTIYSELSFSQLLNTHWTFSSIKHINIYIGFSSYIKRVIHIFFLYMTKLYYITMWRPFPSIYTWEIITITRK